MSSHDWLKSYGALPTQIDPQRCPSVTALMEVAMLRHAHRVAFRSFDQALSYADVDRLSSDFCAFLQQVLGVQRGDRVAVMMPNLVAFPIAFLGIVRAGAVQVNVNPLYTPRELAHQLNDSGCRVMVIFDGSTGALAEVLGQTPLEHVITVSPGDGTGVSLPGAAVDGRITQAQTFRVALARGAQLQRTPVVSGADDLLFLQYTGGTTGLSKGAMLSHRNLVANTEQFKAFMPGAMRDGEEVIVTAIPLYHIFALMVNFITYFSIGAENWLVANPRDLDGLLKVLRDSRPTAFMGVNTLYQGLTQHPGLREVDWSRLRVAGGGGAAVMAVTSERWQAITGTFIREGYGLSETAPVLTFNPITVDAFSGTTGLPVPGTDIRLLDDEGHEVSDGQPGEVCAKGPQVMSGYWNKPEANAQSFTADGYFKTGDIGLFDERGYLRIVDRKKDMVLVSGFNVYPNEIEAVASAYPGVAECACVGVPDEKTGEAVKLFVVRLPGAALDEAALLAHCRANLTAYKVPKIFRFMDSLPKSTVGKILRRELRDVD